MLAKKFRLKKRTEFAYSYKKGRPVYNNYLTLIVFNRSDKLLRIGFSVSKKIGNAIVRNKTKRQMRAIVYDLLKQNEISRGYNLIFITKQNITELNFEEIKNNIKNVLLKGKVIINL